MAVLKALKRENLKVDRMVAIVAAMMGFQRDSCEGLLTVVWMVEKTVEISVDEMVAY